MGLLFSQPVPPRPEKPPRKSFLFPFAEEGTKRPISDSADSAVVALFSGLQKVWRRQGTLRRTYHGMPSSPEERAAWKQLIEYLVKGNSRSQED